MYRYIMHASKYRLPIQLSTHTYKLIINSKHEHQWRSQPNSDARAQIFYSQRNYMSRR